MKANILKEGDKVGIVALSSPIMHTPYEKSYKRGVKEILKMGFKVKEGRSVHLKKWHFAGSDKERARDLMNMFLDKNVKAIISAVGGAGANRILNLISYSIIKKNPKPIMGISDTTVITSALFQLTKNPCIYGPDVCFGFGGKKSFIEKKWELSKVKQILTSKKPLGKVEPLTKWKKIKGGVAKGYLVGGHLGLYSGLKGTKYFVDIKNKPKIFFWEATGKYSHIDRDLTNLKLFGFFKNVVAMIVGKFHLMTEELEFKKSMPSIEEIIKKDFEKCNFPIITNVDFGHCTPNIPFPYGKLARVNADKLSLEILESVF